MKQIKIIDCTLRDGGYYNKWDFSCDLVKLLVKSLYRAGIDIIEMGYKSPSNHKGNGFEGLHRYCNESQLVFLKEFSGLEFAFMIDAKEYIHNNEIDYQEVDTSIGPARNSLFSWVRVASFFRSLEQSLSLSDYLSGLGYKVSLNLMQISLLSEEQLLEVSKAVGQSKADVIYLADSFGSLEPAEFCEKINFIREHYRGSVGIHAHDNQGLAFANTIAAISNQVDFVDSTVMGIGRGAGNLRTEQLLLYLYYRNTDDRWNPIELVELIDTFFIPLHQQYQWGWSFSYMLSALQNIHSTYCQKLQASKRYSMRQVHNILNGIANDNRISFSEDALLEAVDYSVNNGFRTEEVLIDLPLYKIPACEQQALVIGTGPSVERYQEAIAEFIRQNQPYVVECNPRDDKFKKASENYTISMLNWMRLREGLENLSNLCSPIVTGLKHVPESVFNKAQLYKIPCHIHKEKLRIESDGFSLPAYVVGMFAVSLAVAAGAQTIYLAGFDGYHSDGNPKHSEMETFWKGVRHRTEFLSLTPTTYSLKTESLYRYLQ
jgi:4-hydroxy 2-oxovalerate aldolase